MLGNPETLLHEQARILVEQYGTRDLESESELVADVEGTLDVKIWNLNAYDHDSMRELDLSFLIGVGVENDAVVKVEVSKIEFTDSISGTVSLSIDTGEQVMCLEYVDENRELIVTGNTAYLEMFANAMAAIKRSIA